MRRPASSTDSISRSGTPMPAVRAVRTQPGQSVDTVMPTGRSSTRRASSRALRPALLAQ